MGIRRVKIIEITLNIICIIFSIYCIFCMLIMLKEFLIHFNLISIYNKLKNEKFIEITFSFLLSSFFSGVLFYYSIRRERKKEERNQRLEWYNEVVLKSLLKNIQNYFDTTEDLLKDTRKNVKSHRKKRNKVRKELDCLIMFDEILYRKIREILLESIDNFNSEEVIQKKIKENTRLKITMLQHLFEKTKNI